eukprot:249121-Chlamydomonas_euryale.AAC.17
MAKCARGAASAPLFRSWRRDRERDCSPPPPPPPPERAAHARAPMRARRASCTVVRALADALRGSRGSPWMPIRTPRRAAPRRLWPPKVLGHSCACARGNPARTPRRAHPHVGFRLSGRHARPEDAGQRRAHPGAGDAGAAAQAGGGRRLQHVHEGDAPVEEPGAVRHLPRVGRGGVAGG